MPRHCRSLRPEKVTRFRPKLLESVAIWAVAIAPAGCQNAAMPRRSWQQLWTAAAVPGDRPGGGAGRGEPMSRATILPVAGRAEAEERLEEAEEPQRLAVDEDEAPRQELLPLLRW